MNSKAFFGGVVVSPEADMVARELIHELHIPKLHNLAFLLEINKCFDDHQALSGKERLPLTVEGRLG